MQVARWIQKNHLYTGRKRALRTGERSSQGSSISTMIEPNIRITPANFAWTSVKPIQLPMKLSGVARRIA